MTHRGLAILAVTAAVIVVVAIAVSPLLHHERPTAVRQVTDVHLPSPLVDDEIVPLATLAATRAVGCQPPHKTSPRGWCGRFTVTRFETVCRTAARCQVDLIGAFTSADASTPIALTVTVEQHAGRWWVSAVSS